MPQTPVTPATKGKPQREKGAPGATKTPKTMKPPSAQQVPGAPKTPKTMKPVEPPQPEPPPVGHNGGRSQLNLFYLQYGGDYAFINYVKQGQTWYPTDNVNLAAPSDFNANGYPTRIVGGGVSTRFYLPSATKRPGDIKLRWKGSGTVSCSAFGSHSGTDAEFQVTPNWSQFAQFDLAITAISGEGITDIAVYHADEEDRLDAGQVFTQHFLDILREGNWGVLRMLDWQEANRTNVVSWSHRKPIDYVFYAGDELRADIYAGKTTHSGDNYQVAAPPNWAGLLDKSIVTVQFDALSAGTAPTLDVAGTGPKPIKSPGGDVLHTNSRPNGGGFSTMVYDEGIGAWLKTGGDFNGDYRRYLNNGAPPEIMIRLCEEVGAHPWICRPYLSADPCSDWLPEFAKFCRDRPSSAWMVPRFEVVPNEDWNPSAPFYGTPYSNAKALANWPQHGTPNLHNWVGKVGSTGGKALSEVYAGDRSRYWAITGVQTWGDPAPDNRLAAADYVAFDGGEPAHMWITHVAVADYITLGLSTEEFNKAVADYKAGDATQKAAIADAAVRSMAPDGTGGNVDKAASFLAWAQRFNPSIGVTCYEGGFYYDYSIESDDADNFYRGCRMSPELIPITLGFYNDLVEVGAVNPSHYVFTGSVGWSLREPDLFGDVSPQEDAIKTFNSTA